MLPVVPGPPSPSSPPTAAVHHPQHPQPVDAETELQGRIRNIEFKVLMYTQLAVLNNQRLCDLDKVVLKDGSLICKCRSAKCMACIWEAKIIPQSGDPGIRGDFTMQNPVFITWLYLTMLIDIHTPLIIPNQVPVDARYGETINLNSHPICRPNNCNLQAVCGALEQKLLPQNHPAHENKHANYHYYESIGGYTAGANAIFEMHNSACRLIKDQLSVIDARLLHLTCTIARLRENHDGYVCINPGY
jgi:hypothetical protein